MVEEITVLGKILGKSPQIQELQEHLKALRQAMLAEKGCLLYEVHKDSQNPTHYLLLKKFASQSALESYFGSPVFQKNFNKINELSISPPEFTYLERI